MKMEARQNRNRAHESTPINADEENNPIANERP